MASVLFLGPREAGGLRFLAEAGEAVEQVSDPVDPAAADRGFEFLVSHRYGHIVPAEVLELFPNRAVNLHISYLPWNRGTHPNVWSAVEGTPSGVTLHHMDLRPDTGDIIAQRELRFSDAETLRSSYELLDREVVELLATSWDAIKAGAAPRRRQTGEGSYHRDRDLEAVRSLFEDGWDTELGVVRRRAGELGLRPAVGCEG